MAFWGNVGFVCFFLFFFSFFLVCLIEDFCEVSCTPGFQEVDILLARRARFPPSHLKSLKSRRGLFSKLRRVRSFHEWSTSSRGDVPAGTWLLTVALVAALSLESKDLAHEVEHVCGCL